MIKAHNGLTVKDILDAIDRCATRKLKKWDPSRCPTCLIEHDCWTKKERNKLHGRST